MITTDRVPILIVGTTHLTSGIMVNHPVQSSPRWGQVGSAHLSRHFTCSEHSQGGIDIRGCGGSTPEQQNGTPAPAHLDKKNKKKTIICACQLWTNSSGSTLMSLVNDCGSRVWIRLEWVLCRCRRLRVSEHAQGWSTAIQCSLWYAGTSHSWTQWF